MDDDPKYSREEAEWLRKVKRTRAEVVSQATSDIGHAFASGERFTVRIEYPDRRGMGMEMMNAPAGLDFHVPAGPPRES